MFNDFYDIPHTNRLYKRDYKFNPFQASCIAYFDRYLLQKAMSVFKWTIPESWDLNFLLYNLYIYGYVCISKIGKYGVIPQFCTINGFNIFYNPARCIITNPYLKVNTPINIDLGKNGELLQLTPDFIGILDVVNQYSEMLANAICAVNTNLYNSRLAYMFYAENRSQAESFKKMYDDIGTGIPAVFVDRHLMTEDVNGNIVQPFEPFNANLKNTYIGDQLLKDIREIEHQFAQKIGLPNANTEKRERLNLDETNKTDIESVSNVALWREMLKKSITKIKKLYPDLTLDVDYRFPVNVENVDNSVDNRKVDNSNVEKLE